MNVDYQKSICAFLLCSYVFSQEDSRILSFWLLVSIFWNMDGLWVYTIFVVNINFHIHVFIVLAKVEGPEQCVKHGQLEDLGVEI